MERWKLRREMLLLQLRCSWCSERPRIREHAVCMCPFAALTHERLFKSSRATRVGTNEHPQTTTLLGRDIRVHQLDLITAFEVAYGFAVTKLRFMVSR